MGTVVKFTLYAVGFITVALLAVERFVTWRIPTIAEIAQSSPPAMFTTSFQYSQKVSSEIADIAKELDASAHFRTVFNLNEKNRERFAFRPVGVTGFFSLDVDSSLSGLVLRRLDKLIGNYWNVLNETREIEEETAARNEYEIFEYEDSPQPIEPEESDAGLESETEEVIAEEFDLSHPLHDFLDTFWNAGFVSLNLAANLDLEYMERLKLGGGMLLTKNDTFLKSLLIRTLPMKLQQYVLHQTLGHTSFHTESRSDGGVHQGTISLSAKDFTEILDAACPGSAVAWDACSLFALNRSQIRVWTNSLFELVSEEFQIKLNFYWAVKGSTVFLSNKLIWVEDQMKEKNSSVTDLTSLTPAFEESFLEFKSPLPEAPTLSVGMNMGRIQDAGLQLLAILRSNIRKETLANSELLGTPHVDEQLAKLEDTLLELQTLGDVATLCTQWQKDVIASSLWLATENGRSVGIRETLYEEQLSQLLQKAMKWSFFAAGLPTLGSKMPTSPIKVVKHRGWTGIVTTIAPSSVAPLVQRKTSAAQEFPAGIY